MLNETFDRYQMSDQEQVSLIQEPQNAFRRDKVAATLSTYWDYFDPGFLFLRGGPSMTTSTGAIGVFLIPLVVLLPVGVYALLLKPDPAGLHAIVLSASSPRRFAATLKGQPYMIQRVLFMLPYVAFVAAAGWAWMWDSGRRFGARRGDRLARWRAAAVCRLLLRFLHALPFRSAFYYDPAAFRRRRGLSHGRHDARR